MNLERVKEIAAAVLYEGYLLYPYRPSSIKNQQRWTFGGVFPRDYVASGGCDSCYMQTQCLLRGGGQSSIEVRLRFLHLIAREVILLNGPAEKAPYECASACDGGAFAPWEEALEREIVAPATTIAQLLDAPARIAFAFPRQCEQQLFRQSEQRFGVRIRTGQELEGALEISVEPVADAIYRLTARVENLTPLEPAERECRDKAQRRAFASTHAILSVSDGAFISSIDPPDELRAAAAACENQGVWPVLAGDEEARDMVLASPIILYDFPQIAAESPGDLFDATEIDEILVLRILAMTDAEKREMAGADERARALLERTQALGPEERAKLHGALREPRLGPLNAMPPSAAHSIDGVRLSVGDRVRLRPKAGGDIMDLALKDKAAVVEAIETDFEDRVHVAVTLLDDPGRDLGLGRYPGHRFFFAPEEVESFAAGRRT